VEETPRLSQLRDVNAHTLSGLLKVSGALPLYLGIARDRFDELDVLCRKALAEADLVLISGGSSVGSRDFTLDVVRRLSDSEILVHGVSISPGKPTILARCGHKAIWGLPGQVTSAMIVFHIMIRRMVERIGGLAENRRGLKHAVRAELSRNVPSVQGREDYVRVRLVGRQDGLRAEPILGKSGLINTMVKADGLIRIDMNSEGLDKGTVVEVMPF
jgi:molybdopterin molybdotransferase